MTYQALHDLTLNLFHLFFTGSFCSRHTGLPTIPPTPSSLWIPLPNYNRKLYPCVLTAGCLTSGLPKYLPYQKSCSSLPYIKEQPHLTKHSLCPLPCFIFPISIYFYVCLLNIYLILCTHTHTHTHKPTHTYKHIYMNKGKDCRFLKVNT
jgi:hypothetical protein